jgi:2,4-dienoyl-CoA reductase (NADPH2)
MAKLVPGKEEFHETLRYFQKQIELSNVHLRLATRVSAQSLLEEKYDAVVLATGVVPRSPSFPGVTHPKCMNYIDYLKHNKPVGKSVAVVGAGGIGFDVCEKLTHTTDSSTNVDSFLSEWGIDKSLTTRGGVVPEVRFCRLHTS